MARQEMEDTKDKPMELGLVEDKEFPMWSTLCPMEYTFERPSLAARFIGWLIGSKKMARKLLENRGRYTGEQIFQIVSYNGAFQLATLGFWYTNGVFPVDDVAIDDDIAHVFHRLVYEGKMEGIENRFRGEVKDVGESVEYGNNHCGLALVSFQHYPSALFPQKEAR